MRIAVISDTHDRAPEFLFPMLRAADEIWHLGDVCEPAMLAQFAAIGPPLKVVHGNCDSFRDWPLELQFDVDDLTIHLVHIPPRVAPKGVDVLLHGHTHVPRNEMVGGCNFLNPGCITRPNRGAPPSFAWLEITASRKMTWSVRPLRR